MPLTNEQFPEVAGGLRTATSPPASPSEDDLTSPPLSGHTQSSPEGVPGTMGPPFLRFPPSSQPQPISRPPPVPPINTNTSAASATPPFNSFNNQFVQPVAPGALQGQSSFMHASPGYAPTYGIIYPSSSTGPSYPGFNWPSHEPSVSSNPGATETSSTTQGHPGPNTPVFQMPVTTMVPTLGSHEDAMAQESFNLQAYEGMYSEDQWDDDFSTGQWLPKQNLTGPAQGTMPHLSLHGEPEPGEDSENLY